jgi:RHS repeat-associated protein
MTLADVYCYNEDQAKLRRINIDMITSLPNQLTIIKLLLLMQIKQINYQNKEPNQCDSRPDQYNDKPESMQPTPATESALLISDNHVGPTRLDHMGRVMSTTDVYGDTTTFEYDTTYEGRLVRVYEQDDLAAYPSKRYTYSKEGNYFKVLAEFKELDNRYLTSVFYTDALGMKAQTKVKSEVDGVMQWVVSGTTEYDTMGRAIKAHDITTAPLTTDTYIDTTNMKETGNITYDDMSVPVKMNAKYSATEDLTIQTDYDIEVESGNGRLLAYNRVYDNTGINNTVGHDSKVWTDMSGVQVKTDNKGIVTTMEYNISGYAKLNEGMTLTGEKQYDSLGRLTWIKSPDAGRKQYFYNDKGLVWRIWDYGKTGYDATTKIYKETVLTYDEYNRITNINYTGSSDCNVAYTYYPTDYHELELIFTDGRDVRYYTGNIRSVTKGNDFGVVYEYEKYAIKETKTIEGVNYATKYEYDIQGRINKLTYPGTGGNLGEVVTYAYNEGGSLKSISSSAVNYISNIKYDKYGQKTSQTYGNGQVQTYTYDENTGLLKNFKATNNGKELLNYTYTFNKSGNITNIADASGNTSSTQAYTYDSQDRLASSTGTYTQSSPTETRSYNENYTYDNINRILTKTSDNMSYVYNYDNPNHSVSSVLATNVTTGIVAKTKFNYDDYGNLTKKQIYSDNGITLSGTEDYVYNAGGELTKLTMPGNKTLDFKYDAGGNRTVKVYKENGVQMTKMVYVNGFYDIKNDRVTKHISDGNYIFASKVNDRDDKILYYSQNHIGSTAMLTDKNGAVVQKLLYKPYGETWIAKGSSSEDIERFYTGQIKDESGLYYYNARYYDPKVGMFISADPAMSGANFYEYANNNPLAYNDPTGLFGEETWGNMYAEMYGGMYGVEQGNTLTSISMTQGGSVEQWLSANPQITNPDLILTGEALNRPGSANSVNGNSNGPSGGAPEVMRYDLNFAPTSYGEPEMSTLDKISAVVGSSLYNSMPALQTYSYVNDKMQETIGINLDGIMMGMVPAMSVGRILSGVKAEVTLAEEAQVLKTLGQEVKGLIKSGSDVTESMIRQVMKDAPLKTQQGSVSLPAIQRYVDMLLKGDIAPAIKVENGIIVDGNHRYIAGRLLGQEPTIQFYSGGNTSQVKSWMDVFIDTVDWGNY